MVTHASWLRQATWAFWGWVLQRAGLKYGPHMIQTWGAWWLYLDPAGDLYQVEPTGDPHNPLRIHMVRRAR